MLNRRFLLLLLFLLLFFGVSDSQAFLFSTQVTNTPTIAFTALANGNASSTVAGSGTYTLAAPSGLTSAIWGGGCSGSSTVTGFSAGAGTWSATFSTPSTGGTACTITVTGTGSNTATATSVADTVNSLAFTALSNGNVSSTVTGSGVYAGSAPSGLTSATWGGGCTGSSTVTGFSASGGVWSATFSTPTGAGTGCTVIATGTGSNTLTVTSPGVTISSGSGSVAYTLPSGDALHYMSPTGSDAANGLTPATAWASRNHALHCGDPIIAAAGTYAASAFNTTNSAVTNCPSTTGGIDGTGGVNGAIMLCGGTDLGTGGCTVNSTAFAGLDDIEGIKNWIVSGWTCNGGGSNRCWVPRGCTSISHHMIYVNDIAYNTAQGFGENDCGGTGGQGTIGIDYHAVIGSIAQNAAQDTICLAAIDAVAPGQLNANAGTHIYFYSDFSYANVNTSCQPNSDTESFMFDTWDAHNVTYQGVIANNIGFDSDRMCIQLFWQDKTADAATMKLYNNTCFQDNTHTGGNFADGEINVNANGGVGTLPWITTILNNIAYQPLSISVGGGAVYAANFGNAASNYTNGSTGSENVYKANNTSCLSTCNAGNDNSSFGGATYLGVNTYVNPAFTNTADLLANQIGVPNCNGKDTVTKCMGYDPTTSTLTTPSVISDLTPTAVGTTGKGYQLPSTTCTANADYPTWTKAANRLKWNSGTSTVTVESDLATKPCGL